MTKPNIPKKLELIDFIKVCMMEIDEWTKALESAQKQLEKLEGKN